MAARQTSLNLKEASAALAELEVAKRRLLTEIAAGEAGIRGIEGELQTAKGRLCAAAAIPESASMVLQRRSEMKKAERGVADLEGRIGQEADLLVSKRAALEEALAGIERLTAEMIKPREALVRKRVEELGRALSERQAEALAIARQLVGLYEAMEAKVPRKIIRMATNPVRYIKVRIEAEPPRKLAGAGWRNTDTVVEDHAREFHVEILRALEGERKGKWKILPGQDLSVRPDEIEIEWGARSMPADFAWVADLDLGDLLTMNGKGPVFAKDLDFNGIASSLTAQEKAAATKFIEEGDAR